MRGAVYIETSVVSYYAGNLSRDLVIAARQQETQEWWQKRRKNFDTFISKLVLDEAAAGDPEAAARRLKFLEGIPLLVLNDAVLRLAELLLRRKAIPAKSPNDAAHIAAAAVHGMDYLITWNFAHLNNAETKGEVEETIRRYGFECPVICSPEELMGG